MNEFDRDLRQFVIGATRVDGWKSEWRREMERRSAEEAAHPARVVSAAQIRARRFRAQPASPGKKKPSREYFKRECEVCGTKIRDKNKTGRCVHHKLERPLQPERLTFQCGACDKPIRKTVYGVCKPCFTRYRRRIMQNRPRCMQCNTIIRSKTKYGLCRECARPIHNRTASEAKRKQGHAAAARPETTRSTARRAA